MARPRIRLIPLSRAIAENLVVGVEGGDAAAMRMLLALLSRAAPSVPETDEENLDLEWAHRFYSDDERVYAPLYMALAPLREDLGRAGLAVIKAAMPAVAALRVGLRDEPRYGLHPPVRAMMLSADNRRVYRGTVAVAVTMETTLRAAATGLVQAVWMDTRALRRFRCRYSAILYLRALAALQRPPVEAQGAKVAPKTGKLWFEIPAAEAQAFLGVAGIGRRADVTRHVMEPAVKELAEVGVDLSLKWRENYRGEATALRVGVASTEETRRRALAELAKQRAATVAARRAARRERRVAAIRQAGGSSVARLRYLSRRRRQPEPQEG